MNLEGKIVFISGAITGVDGYRKIFADAERWLREQDCTLDSNEYADMGLISDEGVVIGQHETILGRSGRTGAVADRRETGQGFYRNRPASA